MSGALLSHGIGQGLLPTAGEQMRTSPRGEQLMVVVVVWSGEQVEVTQIERERLAMLFVLMLFNW